MNNSQLKKIVNIYMIYNGTQTHNHLFRKQTLKYSAKLDNLTGVSFQVCKVNEQKFHKKINYKLIF